MTTTNLTTTEQFEPRALKMWKLPSNYAGAPWFNYYVVIGRNRDSCLRENVNFEHVDKALCDLNDKHPEWQDAFSEMVVGSEPRWDGDDELVIINPCENHWAVGWVEWIGVHKDAPVELLKLADELMCSLEDCPSLDYEELSQREWNGAQEFWVHMRLRERVELCLQNRVSIFAARHDYIPDDGTGAIFEYCRPK